VTIESVVVGDRHVAFAGTDPRRIEVAPGVNRIEIHYTALSFAGPEKVVFRRQLRPIEPSPTHVAGERTAVYSFLPPGEYVFHVTAANNDGVWNPRGADLVIILQPHFWQTAWFKVASVLTSLAATAGVAWSISRRRLARRLERLNRERAIERERMRIAHDMHDELGAQLTTITMLSESARRTSAPPVRTQQQLQQIYETARHVTKAMDEIVWAVNPKHDTFESLVAYFEKFTVDFLRAANVRCRLDLPLDAHAWTPSSEVRHQLFLCLKEALNNVVRHSAADTVTLSIRVSDTTCTMIIADNGAAGGSSTAGEPPDRFSTGNGLSSMQERMQRIQGTCTVESNGAGWVLTFTVPLAANAPAAADTE
jgi:signal transduction histidine kinase